MPRVSDGLQRWSYYISEYPVQPPPVYSAMVTFTGSTSYDRAIQVIGDLGLKTFAECRSTWVPEDDRDFYASNHSFSVAANANSAPFWLERLLTMPAVAQAQPIGPHSCPMFRPGPTRLLDPSRVGTYLQINFTSDTAYLKAWKGLNALGFRLANPCYEKERAQSHKPTWLSAGEESSFAQTSALIVATTPINAVTWQQQLQSAAGVKQITTLSGSTCRLTKPPKSVIL